MNQLDSNHKGRYESLAREAGMAGLILGFIGSEITISSVIGLIHGMLNPELDAEAVAVIIHVLLMAAPLTLAIAVFAVGWMRAVIPHTLPALVFIGGAMLFAAALIGNGLALGSPVSLSMSPDCGSGSYQLISCMFANYLSAYGAVLFTQAVILGGFLARWYLLIRV